MKLISKAKKLLNNNKQLALGVAIGALIMLPTGLYLNERSNNRQASDQTTTTPQSTTDSSLNELTPIKEQSTNQSNSQQSNGSTSTSKPNSTYTPSTTPTSTYKPYSCTKTPIPYKTYLKLATYLGTTSTDVSGGVEGYTSVCTPDSYGNKPNDANIPAVDKTIYVGTGGISATTPPRTTPPEPDQLDRIKADCSVQLAKHGNQDAYNLCVSTLARYFNIPL